MTAIVTVAYSQTVDALLPDSSLWIYGCVYQLHHISVCTDAIIALRWLPLTTKQALKW